MTCFRHLCFIAMCALAVNAANAQTRPEIPLPLDPSTPVIVLAYSWGLSSVENPPPALIIRGDGSVTATGVDIPGTFGDRMSAAELQDLLHFIIDDQHFFDFNSPEAQANRRGGVRIRDASTVAIRIRIREKEMEAEFQALARMAEFYFNVTSLVELARVEKELRRLNARALAGGKEVLDAALRQANEYVQAHPEFPVLTMDDYSDTTYRPPARRKAIHFVRELGNGNAAHVTVTSALDGKAEVSGEFRQSLAELLRLLR
jgi:hypothetical protein